MTVDKHRRRILLAATSTAGGVGLAAASVPFIASMQPSAAARAAGAPVEVDLSGLSPGDIRTVEWRGKPIWIVHRTEGMLARLGDHDALLADPQSSQPQQPPYCSNPARAIRPPYFVAVGICTHLGCIPVYRPEDVATATGADGPGGFYCPCHGSKFDLSGRVFKNVPAPLNLEVPEYGYLSDTRLVIGEHVGPG
ncbi:ubiquinol-cytochrome c reductase iron-sulfur subunit [Noviherbaspirillum sp. ST9]|uniref:ubiquinol-cytochrome c reductase iron-sulfur subunit n=1 Tax=Noviherbaspirillum sp. ST9 TaxID=3401606 RepID=UPI003B58778E